MKNLNPNPNPDPLEPTLRDWKVTTPLRPASASKCGTDRTHGTGSDRHDFNAITHWIGSMLPRPCWHLPTLPFSLLLACRLAGRRAIRKHTNEGRTCQRYVHVLDPYQAPASDAVKRGFSFLRSVCSWRQLLTVAFTEPVLLLLELAEEGQPELAMVAAGINLNDAEFKRVSRTLHAAYLPRCRAMCLQIDAQNTELQTSRQCDQYDAAD